MNKGMNQKKSSKYDIQGLNASTEVKEALEKIKSVAASENQKIKSSVKDLFIKSPSCKELSKIARCYEGIITENKVYPLSGAKTYLELAFPNTDNPKEYKDFFASPALVSATRDYFAGVFLVSFEQWKGAYELIRSPFFKDLLRFIHDNKDTISFVFHVKPDFRDGNVLYNELSKLVNLVCLEHSLPDLKQAVSYVEVQLAESGIKVAKNAKCELKRLVEEKIDITSQDFEGYVTLEQLVANLQFELYAQATQKTNSDGDSAELYMIGKEDIRSASAHIKMADHRLEHQRKLGFN